MTYVIQNGRGEFYGGPETEAHLNAWYERGEYSAWTLFDDAETARTMAQEINARMNTNLLVVKNYGADGQEIVAEFRMKTPATKRYRRYKDYWFAEMEAGRI